MSVELVRKEAEKIERVLIGGDLAKLSPEERVSYYRMVCESVGLNPLTKPLEYITLNGKLTLYARKDCTDQLRNINNISIIIPDRTVVDDCFVVTAQASTPVGRTDASIGAVSIAGLKGEAKCNAMMKAETKAKRRVTLSMCGLGILDETEIESIPASSKKAEVTTVSLDLGPVGNRADVKLNEKGSASGAVALPTGQYDITKGIHATVSAPMAPPQDMGTDDKIWDEPFVDEPTPASDKPITQGQAVYFARKFKESLRKELQKDAENLRHHWLELNGFKDVNGIPTALAITTAAFDAVVKEGCAWAKKQ